MGQGSALDPQWQTDAQGIFFRSIPQDIRFCYPSRFYRGRSLVYTQNSFWGYPWRFIVVWAPFTIVPAMILIAITGTMFSALRLLKMWFPLHPEVQTDRRTQPQVIQEEASL